MAVFMKNFKNHNKDGFVRIQEFTQVIIFLFFLKSDNFKNEKFGISRDLL